MLKLVSGKDFFLSGNALPDLILSLFENMVLGGNPTPCDSSDIAHEGITIFRIIVILQRRFELTNREIVP